MARTTKYNALSPHAVIAQTTVAMDLQNAPPTVAAGKMRYIPGLASKRVEYHMKMLLVRNKKLVVVAIVLFFMPTAAMYIYRQVVSIKVANAAQVSRFAHRIAFTLYLTEVLRRGTQSDPGRVASQYIVAQKQDGSRSEITIYFPGQPQEHRLRLIRLSDATRIIARDAVGLKTTWSPTPKAAQALDRTQARRPTPESNCTMDQAGKVAFRGYQVVGANQHLSMIDLNLTQFVDPGSSPHTDAWYAPALDCEEVYRLATFSSPHGSSEKSATSYIIGEPDQKWFDVSSMREASPITSFTTQYRKAGYPEDFIQQRLDRLNSYEQQYQAQKP